MPQGRPYGYGYRPELPIDDCDVTNKAPLTTCTNGLTSAKSCSLSALLIRGALRLGLIEAYRCWLSSAVHDIFATLAT